MSNTAFTSDAVNKVIRLLDENAACPGPITLCLGHNVVAGCEFVVFNIKSRAGKQHVLAKADIYDNKPDVMYVVELDAAVFGSECFAAMCSALNTLFSESSATTIVYDEGCRNLQCGLTVPAYE